LALRTAADPLAKAVADVAKDAKVKPLPAPWRGIQPGWVSPDKGPSYSQCWTVVPTPVPTQPGWNDKTIKTSSSSKADIQLAVKVLNKAGVRLAISDDHVKTVDMTLTGFGLKDPQELKFNFDQIGCAQEFRRAAKPVIVQVLQMGSIDATVTATDNTSCRLDLDNLNAGKFQITGGGGWEAHKNAALSAKGDSLVIGANRTVFRAEIKKCTQRLTLSNDLGELKCGDDPDHWYRAAIYTDPNQTANPVYVFKYQTVGPSSASQVTTISPVQCGAVMTLATTPRRQDRAVITWTGGKFALDITASFIAQKSDQFGVAPAAPAEASLPSWKQANEPFKLSNP
jgi:hypothetical protein